MAVGSCIMRVSRRLIAACNDWDRKSSTAATYTLPAWVHLQHLEK
jgi:hypothetical protein